MKKFLLIVLIIFGVSAVLASVLTWGSGAYGNNNGWTQTQNINQHEQSSLRGISIIAIESVSSDVNIVIGDVEQAQFDFVGHSTYRKIAPDEYETPRMKVETLDDKITVRIDHPENFWRTINFGGDVTLTVTLPQEYNDTIHIETVSGDVFVDEFTLKTLKIIGVSSDIISKAQVHDFSVETVSGDSTNALSKKVLISTTSGDVEVSAQDSAVIETISGSVDLDIVEGSAVYFDTVSGGYSSDITTQSGTDFSVSTISGDLHVR